MKIPFLLTCGISMLLTVDASSAVYMWEDAAGVVSFTEDYGSIPAKYREKAKTVQNDQSDIPESTPGNETNSIPASVNNSKVTGDSNNINKPSVIPPQEKKYGGRDESYWLNEFSRLKTNIKSYRQQLDAINKRLSESESNKMSRSDYLSLYNTRKLLEEMELTAIKKQESLSAEADRAGVPQDLR